MEETPTKIRPPSHMTWPQPEPAWAGDSKPWPAAMVTLAIVGYDVHPEAPAPPGGRKKLSRMGRKARQMNQYDIMFSLGNAMSGAPIISGIVKLPNAPVKSGMMTRNIITVACMLKAML